MKTGAAIPRLATVLALSLLLSSGPALAADRVETVKDDTGQLAVAANDVVVANAVLDLTLDAQKKLTALLGLSTESRISVRILPTDPTVKPWPLPLVNAILRDGNKLDYNITLHLPGPRAIEEYLRSYTQVCLYQKIMTDNKSFHAGDSLPILPLWLSEGTLQVLLVLDTKDWQRTVNGARSFPTGPGASRVALSLGNYDWERLVARAVRIHRAPTLETVLTWQDLSPTTLERMWQQAFSYYLVSALTRPGGDRLAFQEWLLTADSQKPPFSATIPPVTDEFAWRSQLERANARGQSLIYSWAETKAELKRAQKITLPASGQSKEITTTINDLEDYKTHPGLVNAVRDKLLELTDLELRGNSLWQPAIYSYRWALTALVNIPPPSTTTPAATPRGTKDFNPAIPQRATYTELIALAKDRIDYITKRYEQTSDYLNWVVVTKSANEQGSAFSSYYELEKNLDSFQPRQADSLNHGILKIERAETAPTSE